MSDKAKEIIALRDRERQKVDGFWNTLWQDAADLSFPREDQIKTKGVPGEDKSIKLYDDTAVMDSQKMASGLVDALFPMGQKAFGYTPTNSALYSVDDVIMWCLRATEITHKELIKSNFFLQLNETLRGGAAVFGTGCLYSEWDAQYGGLNFKDHPVPNFLIKEDRGGNVDTVILSFKFTARQALQEFGDLCSDDIKKDGSEFETESKKYEFIHMVGPRNERNPLMKDNRNMPWECVYVDVNGKKIVREEGYEEFPYHVFRWMKGANEKYGRGQTTESMAKIRMMQAVWKDFIDMANRQCRPPLEVDQNFEGTVNLTPGALNYVAKRGMIGGIEQQVLGNFPVTDKMVEMIRNEIHERYYRDVFWPIGNLTGDRRTQMEIQARVQESMRQLVGPSYRLWGELTTPCLKRCLMLLVRNGRIPKPPAELLKVVKVEGDMAWMELDAEALGVEYTGPLALALQNQQATGFIRWVSEGAQLLPVCPGILDNANIDSGYRRLGQQYGVAADDIMPKDQVDATREARAKQQQAQAAQQAALAAAKVHKDTSGAAEEGSPAEAMMGATQ